MSERTLVEAVAEELGSIIGALLESPTTVLPSDQPVTPRWIVRLTFDGALTGTLSVGIAEDAATTLSRLTMGLEEAPPEAAISDTLLEVCHQGVAALGERDDFKGLSLANSQLVSEPPQTASVTFSVVSGDRFTG